MCVTFVNPPSSETTEMPACCCRVIELRQAFNVRPQPRPMTMPSAIVSLIYSPSAEPMSSEVRAGSIGLGMTVARSSPKAGQSQLRPVP